MKSHITVFTANGITCAFWMHRNAAATRVSWNNERLKPILRVAWAKTTLYPRNFLLKDLMTQLDLKVSLPCCCCCHAHRFLTSAHQNLRLCL